MHIIEKNEGVHAQWVDQFECHVSQICHMVAIAMPMLFYRSRNLLIQT
jgi:hypothetical protein